MLLIVQLVVQEHFVVLLPGESYSNATTFDFKLPVFLLSSVCTFYSIFDSNVQYCQRDCNSFPQGFSAMTVPLRHAVCYSLLVGEFNSSFYYRVSRFFM